MGHDQNRFCFNRGSCNHSSSGCAGPGQRGPHEFARHRERELGLALPAGSTDVRVRPAVKRNGRTLRSLTLPTSPAATVARCYASNGLSGGNVRRKSERHHALLRSTGPDPSTALRAGCVRPYIDAVFATVSYLTYAIGRCRTWRNRCLQSSNLAGTRTPLFTRCMCAPFTIPTATEWATSQVSRNDWIICRNWVSMRYG